MIPVQTCTYGYTLVDRLTQRTCSVHMAARASGAEGICCRVQQAEGDRYSEVGCQVVDCEPQACLGDSVKAIAQWARSRTRSIDDPRRGSLQQPRRHHRVTFNALTDTSPNGEGGRKTKGGAEYAKASLATVVLRLGGGVSRIGQVDNVGQFSFFGEEALKEEAAEREELGGGSAGAPGQIDPATFDFGTFFSRSAAAEKDGAGLGRPAQIAGSVSEHRYELRAGMPRRFKTQVVSLKTDATEEDCAQRFIISTRELFEVMRNNVPVEKRTIEVFSSAIQKEFNFAAMLSAAQAAEASQKVLLRNKTFDPRELRRALLRKVEMVMRGEAITGADAPEMVAHFLNVILATNPKLLYDAQKEAIARHAQVLDAVELPLEIVSPHPLPHSRRNVYGVMPPKLNSWEQPFAALLDGDVNNIVTWWHRNESHASRGP